MSSLSAIHFVDVRLRVRDLDAVTNFYKEVLGFKELTSHSIEKRLSASGSEPAQIVLISDPLAAPRRISAPGLFHTAFLLPSRRALAAVLKRLIVKEARIQGFADHGVSEAIYLADPEGNGIELYRDRPRDTWKQRGGHIAMVTEPLDVEGLLREPGSGDGSPMELDPATTVGHMHLQVSNLEKAEQFYHKLLGFDITQKSYPGALFVSAAGYHHHIGLNIWNSQNSVPVPGTSGLMSFGIQVDDPKEFDAITARMEERQFPVRQTGNGQVDVHDLDGITIHLSCTTLVAKIHLTTQSQEHSA